MNKEKQEKLEKLIHAEHPNIAGISIMRNNCMLYENYFNNCDESSKIHVYSISKSVISILFGIAIDKGYIKTIDQKILSFFPNYKIKRNEKTIQHITIKDMLTMCAPFKYKFPPLTYMRYFMSDDWKQFSLNLLGGKGKIGNFNYTPLVGPDILSAILEVATGQSVYDFAKENLFTPLAIYVEKNIYLHTAKEQTEFNKATTISGWVCDAKGLNAGGWGLTLSPIDMVKLGQLYLNNGIWNNKEIVSSQWINESTKEQSYWEKIGLAYGYLWWVIDQEKAIYAAMGDGGNIIYVNHDKQLVVAIASLFSSKAKDKIAFINDHIEPLFASLN